MTKDWGPLWAPKGGIDGRRLGPRRGVDEKRWQRVSELAELAESAGIRSAGIRRGRRGRRTCDKDSLDTEKKRGKGHGKEGEICGSERALGLGFK